MEWLLLWFISNQAIKFKLRVPNFPLTVLLSYFAIQVITGVFLAVSFSSLSISSSGPDFIHKMCRCCLERMIAGSRCFAFVRWDGSMHWDAFSTHGFTPAHSSIHLWEKIPWGFVALLIWPCNVSSCYFFSQLLFQRSFRSRLNSAPAAPLSRCLPL